MFGFILFYKLLVQFKIKCEKNPSFISSLGIKAKINANIKNGGN